MTPKNLSVCWSPSLSFSNEEPDDLMASLQAMQNDRFVVEFLIKHANSIFTLEQKEEEEEKDEGDDDNDNDDRVPKEVLFSDLHILDSMTTSTPVPPSRPKPKLPSDEKINRRHHHSRTASAVYRDIEHSVSSLSCSTTSNSTSLWGNSRETRDAAMREVMESLRVSADGNIEKARDILKELLVAVEYRMKMLGIGSFHSDSSSEEKPVVSTPRLSL